MGDMELEQRFKKMQGELRELREAVRVLIAYAQPSGPIPPDEQEKLRAVWQKVSAAHYDGEPVKHVNGK